MDGETHFWNLRGRGLHPHDYGSEPLYWLNACYWNEDAILKNVVLLIWLCALIFAIVLNTLVLKRRKDHFFASRSVPFITLLNICGAALSSIWISLRLLRDDCHLTSFTYTFLVYSEIGMLVLFCFLHFNYWVRFSPAVKQYFRIVLKDRAKMAGAALCLCFHYSLFAIVLATSKSATSLASFPAVFSMVYFVLLFLLITFTSIGPICFKKMSWNSDDLGISKELLLINACLFPLVCLIYVLIVLGLLMVTNTFMMIMNFFPAIFLHGMPLCRYSIWKRRSYRSSNWYARGPIRIAPELVVPEEVSIVPEEVSIGGKEPIEASLEDSSKRERLYAKAKKVFCEEMISFLCDAYDYNNTCNAELVNPSDLYNRLCNIQSRYFAVGSADELNIPWIMKNKILALDSKDAYMSLSADERECVFKEVVEEIEHLLKYNLRLKF
mmetsp:Transcript_10434/g.13542  ORF Transcript_10434/g.13542 Transcript_10434/m.13542 type:complete len:439 (+) Transcript_10434:398-1714(+)